MRRGFAAAKRIGMRLDRTQTKMQEETSAILDTAPTPTIEVLVIGPPSGASLVARARRSLTL